MFAAARTPPTLATLILLTAVPLLSLNMFLPSLPGLARDFGVDYAVANLAVAGYLGVTAVLQLVFGPLSDRFGRRPVLLVGIGLFAIASLGCLLATDIRVFLAFRMLQGAVISGAVLSRAVVQDTMPPQEAASRLGYIAMAMAVAPMMAPTLGGFLDQLYGWRATFLLYLLIGLALWALVWVDLGETNKTKSETFAKQFSTYPELFRSRRFWGYSICLAFSIGAFYAFLGGAALVATETFGLNSAATGVALGITTVGFFMGTFVSGRIASRFPLPTMIIAGRIVPCIGLSIGLLLVATGAVTPVLYFACVMSVGLGNGLSVPSANAGAMSVRPSLAGSASGLSGAMTVGGGAILTSFTGTVLTPENGSWLLLAIMMGSTVASALAALYVWRIDLREGATY